jgi:Flp pilus assembly protein CpaB
MIDRPSTRFRRGSVSVDPKAARGCGWLAILSVMNFVLGAASCAALLVLMFVRAELARVLTERDEQLTTVPVLSTELQAGSTIEPRFVTLRTVPKVLVPGMAATTSEELIGRTVRERVLPGEYVRLERLAPKKAGLGINAIIPDNSRAVALNLVDDDRVAGFIAPGNRVDLLVTLPDGDGRPAETVTVAQALIVLAVDERISTTATGEQVHRPQVTLAVPRVDAERVVHAVHAGEAKLTLLSDVELSHTATEGATVSEILGEPGQRMSASEFRAHFDDSDVQRWVEIVGGSGKRREAVIDPTLLRPVPGVGPARESVGM